MSTTKTLAVSAIKNGTVIDHIPTGRALRILDLLKLSTSLRKISLGINYPSISLGLKDFIKLDDYQLSQVEMDQIAILSPHASINIIENYEVKQKFQVSMPEKIANVLRCPNHRCISNHEAIHTLFHIKQLPHEIKLCCHYCRKQFSQDDLIKI